MRLRVEDGRRRLAKLLAVAEKLVEIGDRAHEAIGEGSVGTSVKDSLSLGSVGTALHGVVDGQRDAARSVSASRSAR